ncbi:MAG: outer spore coat protein CotE [Bacilli bacterium]|nr:outer spore coat protein CotE [Bacilli bacterium]
MALYKEIVTKTVIGKVKKHFKNVYTLTPEMEPSTILGCWIINHKFKGHEMGDKIMVDGSFEANIWYSYENDSKTAVVTKKIDYNEIVRVNPKEETDFSNDNEIIVRALKQPNCTRIEIKDNNIEFEIEKELGIELVGDSKVKILVEEDEEPWEVLVEDEVLDEAEKEITENVKEDYLN